MTSSRRRILALLRKDVWIHGRDIALTQLGILGLLVVMRQMSPDNPSSLATAMFGFNFVLAGFWSEWLITREKTKGTFAWLRACPVDDRELVSAKFMAASLCCAVFWLLSSAIVLRSYWFPSRLGIWVALLCALLAFGSLASATRFRFNQKVGQLLPFGVAALIVGVLNLLASAGHMLPIDPEVLLRTSGGRAVLTMSFVCWALACFWLTVMWVRRSDTTQLLE